MILIGYLLIVLANIALYKCGINFTMWEWWVISLGFIIGEFIVCKEC